MKNGTAPYKFQTIVGEVRARLVPKVAFSSTFPAATQNHTLVVNTTGLSTLSLYNPGTYPSHRHTWLTWASARNSFVRHIYYRRTMLRSTAVVVTDAQNNTAVSKLYTVGAGQTNSCFNVAATLTVGSEDTSTYSVSLKYRVQSSGA